MRYSSRTFISLLMIAGLLSGVVLVAPPAAAALSVTWTSTVDFDGGTKSDSGNRYFAANVVGDTPWNGATYPVAVYWSGSTYVVWQGDGDYKIYAARYVHGTQTWSTAVVVAVNPLAGDGHGSPAIIADQLGYLHVFCCAHIGGAAGNLLYRRSVSPGDITVWDVMSNIDTEVTYPEVAMMANGTLYLVYGFHPIPERTWAYRFSTDGGTTWYPVAGRNEFLKFNGTTGYSSLVERYGDRLYFAFNRVNPGNSERYDVYVGYLNMTTQHVWCLPTFDAGLKLYIEQAQANCRVHNSGAWTVYGVVPHLDSSGNPYLIYQVGSSQTIRYFNFTRWTGSVWTDPVQITTTDYTNNNDMDFIVYSSTDIEAFLIANGKPGQGGDVQRWTWDGATWFQQETLLFDVGGRGNPTDPGRTYVLPMVPLNAQSDLKVLVPERGWLGLNSDAWGRIFAWGESGFVLDNRYTSGVYDIETSTDDALVASGTVEFASGKGDTFSYADANGDTWRWIAFNRTDGATSLAKRCNSIEILSGIATANTTATFVECGWSSNFRVAGDFDVRLKATLDYKAPGNTQRAICLYDQPTECSNTAGVLPVSTDGIFYRVLETASSNFAAFNVSAGTVTQVGTTTTVATVTPLWVRLTRATNTFTFFRSSDGSAWTQDEQFIRGDAPSAFFVSFVELFSGTGPSQVSFDNYQLVAGSLTGIETYKRSGSWTSPPIAADWDEAVTSITLQHSNLTADTPIDKVEILRDFQVIETYDTNLTSGSETTLPFHAAGGGYMQVRVTLAGNGSASPTLESVQMTIGARDLTSELVELLLWLFLWIATVVLAFASQPIFGIISGIFGSFAAYDVFTLTGNLPLSLGVLMIALPLMAFSFGEFYKKMTQSEESGTGG